MKFKPQDRVEEQRIPMQGRTKELKEKVPQQQMIQQEWTQVQRKKSTPVRRDEVTDNVVNQDTVQVEKEIEGTGTIGPQILVEEGEIEEVLDSEREEEQEQNKNLLKKSSSESDFGKQFSKDIPKSVEYLTRSHSMNDMPKDCTERRMEYLQEEFHHFHLVSKHLKKTKEETQRMLQLREQRKQQNPNLMEETQQGMRISSQEIIGTMVPETQMVSDNQIMTDTQTVPEIQMKNNQVEKQVEPSQKKKKPNQSASKPLTRAAKKQLSPRK